MVRSRIDHLLSHIASRDALEKVKFHTANSHNPPFAL